MYLPPITSVKFFRLNSLNGTAKAHTVDLLRLNTLRDTKTAFLTHKRYEAHPRLFHMGVPPDLRGSRSPCLRLMLWHSPSIKCQHSSSLTALFSSMLFVDAPFSFDRLESMSVQLLHALLCGVHSYYVASHFHLLLLKVPISSKFYFPI